MPDPSDMRVNPFNLLKNKMYIPYSGVDTGTAIIWLGEVGFGEGSWMPVTGEKRFANLFSFWLNKTIVLSCNFKWKSLQ
ncbi:MAG: hypothetical protein PHD43_04840 [Methylococcales bacterium]|nr:hypothetical protein [Methylococcales bacterium]